MKGIIVSFRRGRTTQVDNQMLINVDSVEDNKKAQELVGKTVSWKSPAGKEIKGKVTGSHGNKGVVKALFETGMPGQSLGTKVDIN